MKGLLFVLAFGLCTGCGFGRGFQAGLVGKTPAQMDYEQAQATLQQVQAEQAMRRHKAEQNLDRVHPDRHQLPISHYRQHPEDRRLLLALISPHPRLHVPLPVS